MPHLQARGVMWGWSLDGGWLEGWCYRGRGDLSTFEPRGERECGRGEIHAAREGEVDGSEGHRETHDMTLKHRWWDDPDTDPDASSSETGGTESPERGGGMEEFSSRGKEAESI